MLNGIDNVQIDARNRLFSKSNFMKIDPPAGATTFAAGEDHTVLLDLAALGGTDYVGTYPITIKTIKFTLNKNSAAGGQTLALKSFYCHYPGIIEPPVPNGDVNGDGEVNIADVNSVIAVILNGESLSSADVNGDGEINIADINAVIDFILAN